MKVHKMFLVRSPEVLDDSYASVAVSEEAAGLSIHDGSHSVCFRFDLMDENDKIKLTHVILGLERAVELLRDGTGFKKPNAIQRMRATLQKLKK